MACVYLLHIEPPLAHASHYVGFTVDDEPHARVAQHLAGQGTPLVRAALVAGSVVTLEGWWPTCAGGRHLERTIKMQKNTARLCPRCGGGDGARR